MILISSGPRFNRKLAVLLMGTSCVITKSSAGRPVKFHVAILFRLPFVGFPRLVLISPGTADNNSEKTGTFTVDGKEFSGKVQVQTFAEIKGERSFSVLVQQDGEKSDFALLQTTFVNEKEARGSSTLKLHSGSIMPMSEIELGIVTVALSGSGYDLGDKEFTGKDNSTGTVKVSGSELTITDLKVFSSD